MQYLDPQISDKNAIFRPILTGHFFAAENGFNMGMLRYETTLIVVVAL